MSLNIFTIAKNAMPYLAMHLPEFEKLKTPFHWTVAHGTSANVACTSWCKEPEPGLSTDGSSEYLSSIKNHPNVTVLEKPLWSGKIEMVNACLDTFKDASVLMQIDSDEIYRTEQLEKIVKIFQQRPDIGHMRFFCRYFVGEDIITVGENVYGNYIKKGEWSRAWRWEPGTYFTSHEPPRLKYKGSYMSAYETRSKGLVFDHYSWALRKTVIEKEKFYGYKGAVEGWDRLQANTKWPVLLKNYFSWVDSNTMVSKVDLIEKRMSRITPSAIAL